METSHLMPKGAVYWTKRNAMLWEKDAVKSHQKNSLVSWQGRKNGNMDYRNMQEYLKNL